MSDERRGLAYHEAGHAVVACALGLRVIEVDIGDNENGPHTLLDPATPPRSLQALIVNRGGMAAEDVFEAPTGTKARLFDRIQAERTIIPRLKRKKSDALKKALQRARELLKQNLDQTTRVAKHLIAYGKIDRATAATLLPPKEQKRIERKAIAE
jgi:hypothetical protein